ncbi:MAG TPA: hypothetical protein VMU54_17910 [Planctomycetota bacterium]|nr:hypothetical protein [Planctomycetota bacterium]
MFTDRWWSVKAASALLLFGVVSARSGGTLSELHPELERTALFTESLRGKTLILWGRKVLTADADGFEIDSRVGPIRVLTPHPPPVGAYVSGIAQPTGPRTLTASSVHVNAGFVWKRPLNYALSILVVIGYLWSVRRLFRWRIAEGVFRGKY